MATSLDRAVVLSEETVAYGTYASADARALEFLDGDTQFEDAPVIVQGQGIRAGSILADGSRSVVVRHDVPGSIGFEVLGKGQGKVWKWLLGACSSTLVSAATYQQVATLSATLASVTAQEQWYYMADDGTYSAGVFSWLGCMFTDFELTMGSEIATVKANLNGRTVDTTQTAVAVTLPSTATAPFHKGNLTVSTGVLTAATTNALASVASETVVKVDQVVLSVNNNLNTDRPGSAGLKGKPVPQMREITVKFTAEMRDNSWDIAKRAQTALQMLCTYTGPALGVGTETFQVAIADMRVTKVTKKVDSGVPKVDVECKVMQTTTPLQIVIRTADIAI